jgi:large subunit ribosomal protein L29
MKNSFKELKVHELVAKRAELRKSYFDFRFQAVVGHVENPVHSRVLRRQIARLETLINGAGRAAAATTVAAATVATAPVVKATAPVVKATAPVVKATAPVVKATGPVAKATGKL